MRRASPRTPINPQSPLTPKEQEAIQEYFWELNQRIKRGLPPSDGHLPLDDVVSLVVGMRYRRAGQQGGRPQADRERDCRMLKEYLRRLPGTNKTPTALMADIGKGEGLGRSRSIEIISGLLKETVR